MEVDSVGLIDIDTLGEYIEYCRANPVFAAKDILNVDLAPHQRIMLKGMWKARWVLNIASRGIGKTFMSGLYALLRALLYSGEKIVIVGPSFRQSIFVFNEMEKIVNNHKLLQKNFKKWPPRHHTVEYKAELWNESTITALPLGTDGSKIRGTRATCIIVDEAREVDKEVIEAAVIPFMVTRKDPLAKYLGKPETQEKNVLVFCTSAYYQFNHVYERYIMYIEEMMKGNEEYFVSVFDFNDVPEGFVEMEVIEMQRQTMSELEFAMEYLAKMPRDSMGFYPASMVYNSRTRFLEPQIRGNPTAQYVMGIDPGDTTGIIIAEVDGFELKIVYAEEVQMSLPKLRQHIDDLLDKFPTIQRIGLEEYGGGKALKDLFLVERIYVNKVTGELVKKPPLLVIDDKETEHIKGNRMIELITPSLVSLNEMNFDLRAKFENQQIQMPSSSGNNPTEETDMIYKNIMTLLRQLTNVTVEETQLGYLKFISPEGQRSDLYSALLYASWAADHLTVEPKGIILPTGGWINLLRR